MKPRPRSGSRGGLAATTDPRPAVPGGRTEDYLISTSAPASVSSVFSFSASSFAMPGLDGLGGAVHELLGLLEAETGDGPHDLDDLDLLLAGALQHDVEGGLLLLLGGATGRRGRPSTAAGAAAETPQRSSRAFTSLAAFAMVRPSSVAEDALELLVELHALFGLLGHDSLLSSSQGQSGALGLLTTWSAITALVARSAASPSWSMRAWRARAMPPYTACMEPAMPRAGPMTVDSSMARSWSALGEVGEACRPRSASRTSPSATPPFTRSGLNFLFHSRRTFAIGIGPRHRTRWRTARAASRRAPPGLSS